MQPYQERVIKEKRDLDYSLDKLRLFNSGDKAVELPREERLLLWRQEKIMVMYSDVLAERIERFNSEWHRRVDRVLGEAEAGITIRSIGGCDDWKA